MVNDAPHFQERGSERTSAPVYSDDHHAGLEKFHAEIDALMEAVGPINFPKPPAGHLVYFVGGDVGPVKIGFTQQPIKERLKCIQNGAPFKIGVLATVNATRLCEKDYHRRFAEYRLHGEWFERSPAIQAEIDRLSNQPLCGQVWGGSC